MVMKILVFKKKIWVKRQEKIYYLQGPKKWNSPKKNGILDSNLNFEKNIKQKNYCLCLFESLFIQLSIGRFCFKFKRVSEKLYYI